MTWQPWNRAPSPLMTHASLPRQQALELSTAKDVFELDPNVDASDAVDRVAVKALSVFLQSTTTDPPPALLKVESSMLTWNRTAVYGGSIGNTVKDEQVQGQSLAHAIDAASKLVARIRRLSEATSGSDGVVFTQACTLLHDFRSLEITDCLAAFLETTDIHTESAGFKQALATATSSDQGKALFNIVRDNIKPLINDFVKGVLRMHGSEDKWTGDKSFPPVVIRLNTAECRARYASHRVPECAALIDAALKAGDQRLFKQVAFLRDTHELLHSAADMANQFDMMKATPESRKITAAFAKRVMGIHIDAASLKEVGHARDLFSATEARCLHTHTHTLPPEAPGKTSPGNRGGIGTV